jgi:acyl-CoA reductase-like NAD-dependent aldehyde dehydrogenase
MQEWVDRSVAAKGGHPAETLAAEEWLSGPLCILRQLRMLAGSLRDLAEGQKPALPGPVRRTPSGRAAVQVLPADLSDRLAFPGFSAEVWFRREVQPEDVPALQAGSPPAEEPLRGTALVLGAGNVSSIAPGDVLHKLVAENRTVLLKTSPVLDYLIPLLQEAFCPLVEEGVLAVIEGDRDTGEWLCSRPEITQIHVTGSLQTHFQVLRQLRSAARTVRLTSELGNVSPVIVVPGPWSDAELDFHAQSIVTMLVNNAGFNCNAARVVILPGGWPGSQRLLDMIRFQLAAAPTRRAYYPGAAQRHAAFLEAHPDALCFGDCSEDRLPWVFITGLDPQRASDPCFTTEPFCGVLAATSLPAPSVAEYLRSAVEFSNRVLWGTLNATLIIHPATREDPASEAAFRAALEELRYGTISVNHWPGIAFGMMSTPWGGHPGTTLDDPQSGLGFVHNTLLLGGIEKAVVESPFSSETVPPWFVTAEGSHRMLARLARMLVTMPSTRGDAKFSPHGGTL